MPVESVYVVNFASIYQVTNVPIYLQYTLNLLTESTVLLVYVFRRNILVNVNTSHSLSCLILKLYSRRRRFVGRRGIGRRAHIVWDYVILINVSPTAQLLNKVPFQYMQSVAFARRGIQQCICHHGCRMNKHDANYTAICYRYKHITNSWTMSILLDTVHLFTLYFITCKALISLS